MAVESGDGRAVCGCGSMSRPRIRLLDGELGVTLIAGGLIVHGDIWEAHKRTEADTDFLDSARAQQLLSTERHEYIHYIQAAGSRFLQSLSWTQLLSAVSLLRKGPHKDQLALFRLLQQILSKPVAEGLSCLDILESGAVLEGYKLDKQDWGVHPDSPRAIAEFPTALARFRSDPAQSRYHVAFDWLERKLGMEAAYLLFMPLSFIAFNTDDPVRRFTAAAAYLGRRKGRRAKQILNEPVADIVARTDLAQGLWLTNPESLDWAIEQGPPVTLAALHIVEVLGLRGALEFFGRPWRLDKADAPQWLKDVVAPLALIWSSASGVIQAQLSDLASQDERVLAKVLSHVATIGMAERLSAVASGVTTVYRFCPHNTCPHYGPALCHRYYLPPPLARHHDTCDFVKDFDAVTQASSSEVWARWGLPQP